MKVEIILQSGPVSMEDTEALQFLSSANLSEPIYLSLPGRSPSRVYVRPGTRPSKPLPSSVLDEFPYRDLLSGSDIFRILSHGRSSVHKIEGASCRFSISVDRFGLVHFNFHRFNPSPSIPGYNLTASDTEALLLNRHLGHTVKPDTPTSHRFYVTYDPVLNDYALLRTDCIYIPTRLRGIPLSFRQRHALSLGRRVFLGPCYAQVDALTASIPTFPL